MYAVILAGGRGTRFWPKSRQALPKQLLTLAGGEATLLAATIARLSPVVPPNKQYVVTSRDLVESIQAGAPEIPPENIFAEPCERNTAAAIALSASKLRERHPGEVMGVFPADHHIRDDAVFHRILADAEGVVRAAGDRRAFVILGVRPTRVTSAYGYIRTGNRLEGSHEVYHVDAFREKPSAVLAREFVESGEYLWNAGMFFWTADAILDALSEYLPGHGEFVFGLEEVLGTDAEQDYIENAYATLESVPIDIGVLEKSPDVSVIPASMGWNDIGSWASFVEVSGREPDAAGNEGVGRFIAHDSRDCIIVGEETLIAAVGVQDLVIVQAGDAILVCHRERAEEVKDLVGRFEAEGLGEYL